MITRFKLFQGIAVVACGLATSSFLRAQPVNSNELAAIRSELGAIRAAVDEQGRLIRRLYDFVNREADFEAKEAEQRKSEQLALERLWDVDDGSLGSFAAFSPTEPIVAAITKDGGIRLSNTDGTMRKKLKSAGETVTGLAHSPDGHQLLTGTKSGKLLVWNLATGESRLVLSRTNSMGRVAWLGKTGAVAWQTEIILDKPKLEGITGTPGELIDAFGEVVDLETGKPLWKFASHIHLDYQTLAAAKDGSYFAVMKIPKDGRGAYLLDTQDGHIRTRLIEGDVGSLSVAVAPDHRTVAVGGAPNGISLWDVEKPEMLRLLKGHGNWVVSLAFSPDSRLLISGSGDSTARVWKVADGTELGRLTFKGSSAYIKSVGFSPDGKLVFALSESGQLVMAKAPAMP